MLEVKVVFLGSSNVGKTSILHRITSDKFNTESLPTTGAASMTKVVTKDDKQVLLRLWDTAGQERYRAIAPIYYQGSHIAIIVFAIDDRNSFDDTLSWLEQLEAHMSQMPMTYLVGNKSELQDKREISIDEANARADQFNATYLEVSAKSGNNIDELLDDISERILSKNIVDDNAGNLNPVLGSLEKENEERKCC